MCYDETRVQVRRQHDEDRRGISRPDAERRAATPQLSDFDPSAPLQVVCHPTVWPPLSPLLPCISFLAFPSMQLLPCISFLASPSLHLLPCSSFLAAPSLHLLPCISLHPQQATMNVICCACSRVDAADARKRLTLPRKSLPCFLQGPMQPCSRQANLERQLSCTVS